MTLNGVMAVILRYYTECVVTCASWLGVEKFQCVHNDVNNINHLRTDIVLFYAAYGTCAQPLVLAYYGHILRKKGDCLEEELIQRTTPGSHTRGRPKMTWIDNIKLWTGLSLTELIRKVEDRHQCRKIVHGAANPCNEDG